MTKNLFIVCPNDPGGSGLLSCLSSEKLLYAGGYITRLSDSQNAMEILPSYCINDTYCTAGSAFLSFNNDGISHDTEAFREAAVTYLKEALNYPFCIIDMFGGFELLIPQYCAALEAVLDSDLPVLGFVIAPDDALSYKAMFHLGDRYDLRLSELPLYLQSHNGTVLDFSEDNDMFIKSRIKEWENIYL